MLGELLILFDDGTTLRIDTDKNFKSHVNAPKGWNKNGFDDSGWTAVLEQAGPPAPPWTGVKLIYKDYTRPQKFIQASATPKNAVAGNTVRLNYEFEGKMPDQPFGITMELFDRDKLCWSETLPLTAGNMVKMEKNRWKIQLDYTLPLYLNSNKFRARIKSGALHVRNGGFPETGFHFTRAAFIPNYTKNPKTSVIDLNGSPSFAIDGKPFYPVWGYPHYVYIPFGQAPVMAGGRRRTKMTSVSLTVLQKDTAAMPKMPIFSGTFPSVLRRTGWREIPMKFVWTTKAW